MVRGTPRQHWQQPAAASARPRTPSSVILKAARRATNKAFAYISIAAVQRQQKGYKQLIVKENSSNEFKWHSSSVQGVLIEQAQPI